MINGKKLALASIAGFAFVVCFEMFWHGFMMRGMYEATASAWRPEDPSYMGYMFASQFLFALAMTFFWAKIGRLGSCKRGIAFGFCAGLVSAAPQLATYSYLPIPLTISLLWMLASLLKGLGSGMVIAAVYKEG